MNTKLHPLVASILVLSASQANAELAFMGPTDPTTGNFPLYYQDTSALALDLCIPDAAELSNGACLLGAVDIPNPSAAISFPDNFPAEAFWWNAGASMTLGNGNKALLVMALEAAFGNGAVVPGDQIVFGRIRIKFNAPASGHYKVTHPYGIEEFDVSAGDLIFFSEDTGLNCGLDFSCAMRGRIGPFLRASATPGGLPLPPVVIGGKSYIADPNFATFVSDGPFGHVFRIEGPDINGPGVNVLETDLFTLMGRVNTGVLGSATVPQRATYTRNGGGTNIDIFANAFSALGQPTPELQVTGENIQGMRMVQNPAATTQFYAHTVPLSAAALPSTVVVSNMTNQPPTNHEISLTDQVVVSQAVYDATAKTLQVAATSSDTSASPPTLSTEGSDGVIYGPMTAGVGSYITDTPPASVTILSSAGGKTTVPVIIINGASPGGPTAVNDTNIDATLPINVLANDSSIGAASVRIIRAPEFGTATVLADQTVQYALGAGVYSGPDSFTYAFSDTSGVSNIATASFDVTASNRAPIAVNDSASVNLGSSVTVNVLANDSDLDGNPLTVTITTAPAAGNAILVGNQIQYIAPTVSSPSPQVIGYTVSDGTLSTSATLSINLLAAEAINVNKADYVQSKAQWGLEGIDTPAVAGVSITVYAGTSVTDPSKRIGTTTTDALGRWKLNVSNSPVLPDPTRAISVKSSSGAIAQGFPHTLR